uniref:Endonuclease/exonuclease/phosphatase domain-containing protein n=1 Tax=Kalanchoe fedtschenkoi TaxID=63787 RepID=A0A7N0ZZX1_KALFE
GAAKASGRNFLKQQVQQHKPAFIAILEPKSKGHKLEKFARWLGFEAHFCCEDINHYIWLLWHPKVISLAVVEVTRQSISSIIEPHSGGTRVLASVVYGLGNRFDRRRLWQSLSRQAPLDTTPWFIAGDFNVISSWDEKKGGSRVSDGGMQEFNSFMTAAGVSDLGYIGSPFTWSNNQSGRHRVWVRLDRALGNGHLMSAFPNIQVMHLPRIGSDHAPILISLERRERQGANFKYLRIWKSHATFHRTIQDAWEGRRDRDPLVNLGRKLKDTAKALGRWNKSTFGNVDQRLKDMELK